MATPHSRLRRLTLSILMPFILLLSQQGAQLHELSHWHAAKLASGSRAQANDADSDLCLTCLGFAQIGGLATFDVPVAPKLDGLRYHFAAETARSVAEASVPVARSRGPPTSA